MSQSRKPETLAKAQSVLDKLIGNTVPEETTQQTQTIVSNSSSPSSQNSTSSNSSSVSSTHSQSATLHTLESKEVSDSPNIATHDLATIDYLKSQSAEILNAAYFLAMTAEPKPRGYTRICALLKFANAYDFHAEARFELLPKEIYDEIERLVKTYQGLDQKLLHNEDLLKPIAAPAKVSTASPSSSATQNKNVNKTAPTARAPVLKTAEAVIKTYETPFLDTQSLVAFARTSMFAKELLQGMVSERRLVEAILGGRMAEVTEMLTANPGLAQKKLTEIQVLRNMAGQRIQVAGKTPYQIALGEEDTQMAAFIKECIVKVASEKEADRQFHEQFPEGWEIAEEKAWGPLFTQLTQLNNAIRDSADGDIVSSRDPEHKLTLRAGSDVAQALNRFTSLLDEKREEIATTGRHFNPKLLLQGFQEYGRLEHTLEGDWKNPRALLSWQRGIGSIEKHLMPANYFQAFSDGFYETGKKLRENLPQRRLFKFQIWNSADNRWRAVSFSTMLSLLGIDIAIYGPFADAVPAEAAGGKGVGATFANLMLSKKEKFGELMPRKPSVLSQPGV